ncbi:unnamed protein product [Cuscuta epithymum]|uniref:Pectinesterase inhibitor domain-containing protein n=1 Tax=Cuscuta epithymum TaxID=186058 RepID=A0AAV0C0L3_9ASTE|nr:unnamed protein product [Cuscuta epithymum]
MSQTLFLYHFLALSFLFTSASATIAAGAAAAAAADTDFIRTACNTTTYPTLCITSLSSRAAFIGADPQLLAHAALSVTLRTARSTAAAMVKMARRHGLARREIGAMSDCIEELSDTVDELRDSLGEMKGLGGRRHRRDFNRKMSDIETWVSAALTDEDTCTEGFAGNGSNGGVKIAVRGRILNVAHLTSNALALVDHLAEERHG